MADDGGDIFVYLGGEFLFDEITHVRIDRSVKIIPERAFSNRKDLVSVETHDGIEKIEYQAFTDCISLRGIKLPGVKEIETGAFYNCRALTDVEFSDKLETIGHSAFSGCSLRKIKMTSVRTIGRHAFADCMQLTDVEFGVTLETIGESAFIRCHFLRRIAIPLKENMFPLDTVEQRYTQFNQCDNLKTVDLVGVERIHRTISSLLLESWKDEMNQELDRINQELPNASTYYKFYKTAVIKPWIESVIDRMEHYKAEHKRLLKEDMTQLELALWKAKLDDKGDGDNSELKVQAKKAKVDVESMRKERRITSGASIVIKNVLPFLQLG